MTAKYITTMTTILRLNMILLVTITFGSFGITQVQKSFAASVKNMAVIEGNIIRAKDLFDGLNHNGETAIGPAPKPGRDMVLNARTLLRIAVALDLSWRPESGMERVVVRRMATIIDQDIITNAIAESLAEKGIEDHYKIVFNEKSPSMTLPQNETASVQIGSFDYDPANGFFQAELVAPSLNTPIKREYISGKVEKIMDLPVLNRAIQGGDIIQASDIKWMSLAAYKVQQDYILNSEHLIGKTPRRMAMAGEPLRQTEIIEPQLIERGETVSISYQSGPIQLIAEGRALQKGARGDLIRVVNYSSNRTIDAVIEGTGSVRVN